MIVHKGIMAFSFNTFRDCVSSDNNTVHTKRPAALPTSSIFIARMETAAILCIQQRAVERYKNQNNERRISYRLSLQIFDMLQW